jgi:hypothetical protein
MKKKPRFIYGQGKEAVESCPQILYEKSNIYQTVKEKFFSIARPGALLIFELLPNRASPNLNLFK